MDLTWQDLGLRNGYLICGVIVAISIVARITIKLIWNRLLPRLIAKTSTTLDDKMIANTATPAANLVLLVGLYTAMDQLSTIVSLGEVRYDEWILHTLYVLSVLTVTMLAHGLLRALADWYLEEVSHKTSSNLDREFLPLIRKLSGLMLYFIAFTIVLKHFGVDISALIATASVASLAVALAAQETLANMISGVTIMMDRPFRMGDRIEFEDGRIGEVVDIGLRSTKIRGFDNNILVIPNKDIAASRVINWGYPNPRARIRQVIGVSFATDVEKAKQVLLDVMRSHPIVLDDPAPGVYLHEIGQVSFNLAMVCWVDHYKDAYVTRDELNMTIVTAFRASGIEMPLPQYNIHMKSPEAQALVGKAPSASR